MSFEKYIPSSDEIKKAERMMNKKQKDLSEAREEGFKLGVLDSQEKGQEEPDGMEKLQREGDTFERSLPMCFISKKGVQIILDWDKKIGYFTLALTKEEKEGKIANPKFMKISKDPGIARDVFEESHHIAIDEDGDVEAIRKKTQLFLDSLNKK